MARSLSQTLTKLTFISSKSSPQLHPPPRLLALRAQSNRSNKNPQQHQHLSDSETDFEFDQLAYGKIEDAIHRIVARRSAPDWLIFMPGSSYWVPPRCEIHGLTHLVGKLAQTLSEEEAMSLTTHRGWPSLSYYVPGASMHQVEMDPNSNNKIQSEDEE